MSSTRYIIFMGAALFAALTAGHPVKPEAAPSNSSNSTISRELLVVGGLTYAEYLLLSSRSPTMLPDSKVESINKHNCSGNTVSSNYTALIDALDKVLRLYDLQEKLLENDNSSIETGTMQFVIDAVLNQTCQWIESLGLSYSGSNETFNCSSSTAQIKKLKALVSTYQLLNAARASTNGLLENNGLKFSGSRLRNAWLEESGFQPSLKALLNGTDYKIHLETRPSCRACQQCRIRM